MATWRPVQFFREVRNEAEKVTWPSRRETMMTSFFVFLMVTFCSIFFVVADQLILWAVAAILGIGK
ncbi:MAG: preprotein translocase subunit SecE [Alphaproteobacteria bacterium]|nr:preprotein translocase subunit SecE [Alphaproteobacteria bacterium]MAS46853.1 preprotein translocase subunit SecE [Alphaproteobacteria bacterium]MAX94948.1 preprotein translocase subunit SecE [Alphaproteobacteria bacterium]MBN53599.1 preprotein translocase subunit SecE [Alphaproteobacteria bacterium]OUT41583.1 MAG: preprotein translocase subunit SecE [Micavibrio sp. TMED2]|tara:strand:+ start:9747 stop:9944 length:198 start_codon:yes stop_codon:yes gene_type:complete